MRVWLSIQYLRAFAVLIVVWYHAHERLAKFAAGKMPDWLDGRAGVDIFFVISGFIMWMTTQDGRSGPAEFWRRRLIRIVPTYWLFTLLVVATMAAAPTLSVAPNITWGQLVQSLLFVPHFRPFQPGQIYPVLSFGWTLNYEMFFYLVFGLALLLGERQRVPIIVGLFGLLAVCGLATRPHSALAITYTSPLLLEFALGLCLGAALTNGWRPNGLLACALAVVGLIGLVSLHQNLMGLSSDLRLVYWGLPAALLVAGAVGIECAWGLPSIGWLRQLGDASYAIYLSHLFSLGVLQWLWPKLALAALLPPTAFIAAALTISALGGIVTYWGLERPLTRWLRMVRIFRHGRVTTGQPRSAAELVDDRDLAAKVRART